MSTKTFHNLPNKKKADILQACFEEFALHNYEKASLSHIVKKLGIAKGSMYQYFKNKHGLYYYLIDYATDKRLETVQTLFDSQKITFKELLVENFMEKIKFDEQHPVMGGFLFTVMKERFADDLGNMEVINKKRIMDLTRKVLMKYISNHKIRSDLDLDIMSFIIVQLQVGIYDFLEIKYGIDYRDNIKKKKPIIGLPEAEIKPAVEQFADAIMNGLTIKYD